VALLCLFPVVRAYLRDVVAPVVVAGVKPVADAAKRGEITTKYYMPSCR